MNGRPFNRHCKLQTQTYLPFSNIKISAVQGINQKEEISQVKEATAKLAVNQRKRNHRMERQSQVIQKSQMMPVANPKKMVVETKTRTEAQILARAVGLKTLQQRSTMKHLRIQRASKRALMNRRLIR